MDKFGLIGRDIDYSFSRTYFKEKFEKENIDASYENFDIPSSDGLSTILKDTFIKGYNVTIPYKEAIIPLLDRLSPAAQAIGAVNTIKREKDGTLTGHNTDFIGFRDSLFEHFKFSLLRQEYDEETKEMRLEYPHKALILGTGGASKGVLYAFEELGITCCFVSRKRSSTPKKQTQLFFERVPLRTYEELDEQFISEYTFIVNCTPLGTYPDVDRYPDIPYEFLNDSHVVFDLIYNPPQTSFMKRSSDQGATTLNGSKMLEIQAEAAWDIWNTAPNA